MRTGGIEQKSDCTVLYRQKSLPLLVVPIEKTLNVNLSR